MDFFHSLNSKLSLGTRLVNIFSSCFSFHKADCHNKESKIAYCKKLDELVLNVLLKPNTIIVVFDTSIRNNIAISITHVHSFNNSIKKTLYHAVDITSIEAELFAIKCRINQAVQLPDSSHIIIITDTQHIVYKIFDFSIHPYKLQSIAIFKDLRVFFNKHSDNSIEFWNCPILSNENWYLYALIDKDTKKFNHISLYLSKTL